MHPKFHAKAVERLSVIELGILDKLYADQGLNEKEHKVFSVAAHERPYGLYERQIKEAIDALAAGGWIGLDLVSGVKSKRYSRRVRLLSRDEQLAILFADILGESGVENGEG